MKLVEAVILWTPNREPFLKFPTLGKCSALTRADSAAEIPVGWAKSFGATNALWIDLDHQGRVNRMLEFANELVRSEQIDSKDIRHCLKEIEDFPIWRLFSPPPAAPRVKG